MNDVMKKNPIWIYNSAFRFCKSGDKPWNNYGIMDKNVIQEHEYINMSTDMNENSI